MTGATPPSPLGTLILLGILMFIVYRILSSLNKPGGPPRPAGDTGGRVFQFPSKRPPAPPAIARLVPYTSGEDPFAGREDALESHQTLIEKGGMNRIGDFTIDQMPGYVIRAFTHPDRSLVGIIYKDPNDLVWVNLVTEYLDGRVVTTSSAESDVISQSRPHGMPLFNHPGLSTDQLLRRHKLETRGVEHKPAIPPEEFSEFFASNYARMRAHIYESEQRAVERDLPPVPFPEPLPAGPARQDATPAAVETGADEDEEFVPTPIQQKRWLQAIYKAVQIPKEKRAQFQSNLVWIFERASQQSIIQTISEYAEVSIEQVEKGRLVIRSDSEIEDIVEPGDLKGAALFEKINAGLPEKKKFNRLPVSLDRVTFYSMLPLDVKN